MSIKNVRHSWLWSQCCMRLFCDFQTPCVVGLYLQQFKAYSKLVFSLHKTKLPWRGEFSRGCKLTLVLFWTWYRCFLCQVCRNNEKSFTSQHGVWKSQKKSHSTLRATLTFWVDKSSLKMPKMVQFGEFFENRKLAVNQSYQTGQF